MQCKTQDNMTLPSRVLDQKNQPTSALNQQDIVVAANLILIKLSADIISPSIQLK